MSWQFSGMVWDHAFALRSTPRTNSVQQIFGLERHIEPRERFTDLTDGFGNRLCVGNYAEAHDHFTYEVCGTAVVDTSKRMPSPCHPMYRYPTKLTASEAPVLAFLEKNQTPEGTAEEKARMLMQELYSQFVYQPGKTTIYTTAGEALAGGCGVCQDYAHILISLCRSCGIPARYVAGMMIGEGATHAWVEIHDGEKWIGLDPTHNRPADDGYIKLSHGRDYQDCILDRGVFRGNVSQQQIIYVGVEEMT